MPSIGNEFKVGLFVLLTGALVVLSFFWSADRIVGGRDASYTLHLSVPSAAGMWPGTQVMIAGVEVGAVEDVRIEGGHAVMDLAVRARYRLPVDSYAGITASGLLGDAYIALHPGTAEEVLQDGDWIELRDRPGDIDEITRNVETITEDLQAVTAVLRELAEDDSNREAIEATLANVEALSGELRFLAERNAQDIDAIVDAVRGLSENLQVLSEEASGDIDEEMEKIKELTDTLQATADDMSSITGKIDAGEGTIGALVNDDETITALNDTIHNANEVIEGFSGLRAEVYYTGRLYYGTQPEDEQFFFGNPLHGGGSNTIGLRLQSQEDFWYVFEIVDYPLGTVNWEERYLPDLGEVYTEYFREPNYRFTFQMEKRWGFVSLRLGVKENGGGIGATIWALDHDLQISADLFDFEFGSYPAIEAAGTPNSRLAIRYEPIDQVYFELGAEQLLLGLRYRYGTGFVGAGFRFDDDDIKLLFATLPIPL